MPKRLPKILKINYVDAKNLTISVLYGSGEDRLLNFKHIFKQEWKLNKKDPEYLLLEPKEFAKVQLENHTLSWPNVPSLISGKDGKKIKVPFQVGADTLYELSEADESSAIKIGLILKNARLAAKLSQQEVAVISGTSRTYITRLESGKQDVEVMTLKKIVEAGLNKHLMILIK